MKKVLSSLVVVLLMVFMFNGFASAAELSSNDIMQLVEQTNTQINQDIKDAQLKADKLMNTYQQVEGSLEATLKFLPKESIAYDANLKLMDLAKERYNNEMDKIVNDLVNMTNARAQETMNIAAENGYKVVCEMIKVVVGDRIVWIDPLRVIGI